jgi:cell division inhibitor SulA
MSETPINSRAMFDERDPAMTKLPEVLEQLAKDIRANPWLTYEDISMAILEAYEND